jgi:hypothetical protein
MAKKQKTVKISFELTKKEFNEMYEELFEEVMNSYADEYGDDDGEDDYIEPKDRARDYFEDMTDSDIIKEYLQWKK